MTNFNYYSCIYNVTCDLYYHGFPHLTWEEWEYKFCLLPISNNLLVDYVFNYRDCFDINTKRIVCDIKNCLAIGDKIIICRFTWNKFLFVPDWNTGIKL